MLTDKNRKRPVFKTADIVKILAEGNPLLQGEYRGTSAEVIEFTDPKTQKREKFAKIAHTIEITSPSKGMETVTLAERAPFGWLDVANYVPALKKGQTVVARLSSIYRDKGSLTAEVNCEDESIVIIEG